MAQSGGDQHADRRDPRRRRPRPLQGRYGALLTSAIVALSPFIVVATASALYNDQVGEELGASRTALAIITGLGTAGYAFGALIGGDLIQRFPQRPLFLICQSLFAAGSLLAAAAGGIAAFGAGTVLIGFATGLLLVVALPPIIRNFPASKMPVTAAVVNLGFFGAVAAGPLIGGAVALGHAWRWLYGGLAGIAALNVVLAFLSLPDQEAPNPRLKPDISAFVLALLGTALPFWASGELTGHPFRSYQFTVPMAVGLACFVALLLAQYHKKEPLSPVKPMWNTFPLVGTLAAMIGGGAFVTFLSLAEQHQLSVGQRSPIETGLPFWPQVIGVGITAALLGTFVRTRYLPIYTLAGMLAVTAGGAVLLVVEPGDSGAPLLVATGLLGLGAGASVSPGLWMAGFSLPSKIVGRTFALVELVRSEADFILAPVMLQVARLSSGSAGLSESGIRNAIWLTVLVTAGLTAVGIALYLAGTVRLPKPDIEGWLAQRGPAFESPPIGASLRRRRG